MAAAAGLLIMGCQKKKDSDERRQVIAQFEVKSDADFTQIDSIVYPSATTGRQTDANVNLPWQKELTYLNVDSVGFAIFGRVIDTSFQGGGLTLFIQATQKTENRTKITSNIDVLYPLLDTMIVADTISLKF